MKELSIKNKNKEIIDKCFVSNIDYPHLNKYNWYNHNGYIRTSISNKVVILHRYIFYELKKIIIPINHVIDHIDNNKLNNTRKNLRIVTKYENSRNKSKQEKCSSKYIGVSFNKNSKIWECNLHIKDIHLYANYKNENFAGHQYNLWCKEYNLKTANFNIIDKNLIKDFILYKSKDKKGGNLPKGICIKNNKYQVRISKIHIGYYKTLDEAIISLTKAKEKIQKEKETKIPQIIIKNENNDCIIELFNKKQEKIGETIVDENIYNNLIKHKLCLSGNYVHIRVNKKKIRLHRYIMDYDEENFVDHINNDPLDNRKCNLRIVTPLQNVMNTSSHKNSSSKYIGVHFNKNKWISSIQMNNKKVYLGAFDNEVDAAKARDVATKEHYGEYGNINFD